MTILKSLRESHGWRIGDAIESVTIGMLARTLLVAYTASKLAASNLSYHVCIATMTALVLLLSIDGRLKEIGEKLG